MLGKASVEVGALPGKARPHRQDIGWYVFLSILSLFVLFPVWMTLVRALSPGGGHVNEGLPSTRSTSSGTSSPGPSARAARPAHGPERHGHVIIAAAQLVTSCACAFAFPPVPVQAPRVRRLHGHAHAAHRGHLIPGTSPPSATWGGSQLVPGLTVPFLATAFRIFLIRQGFMGIPKDLARRPSSTATATSPS